MHSRLQLAFDDTIKTSNQHCLPTFCKPEESVTWSATPRTIALTVGAGRDGDIGWAAEVACMRSAEDTASQTQGSDTKK